MGQRARLHDIGSFDYALAAARSGSLDALGQLFEACRSWLLAVAARELHHDRAAKTTPADCVQDTFLEAQRDFDKFHGEQRGELLNWLRRILLHNLADVRRRYSTSTRNASLERPLAEVTDSVMLIANEKSPSDLVAAEEQNGQLMSALSDLSGDHRMVLRLRHEEGRSFAEIARLMRKPSEDAARKLCERAARTLRQAIRVDVTLQP